MQVNYIQRPALSFERRRHAWWRAKQRSLCARKNSPSRPVQLKDMCGLTLSIHFRNGKAGYAHFVRFWVCTTAAQERDSSGVAVLCGDPEAARGGGG